MPFNLHPTYLIIEILILVVIAALVVAIWRRLRA